MKKISFILVACALSLSCEKEEVKPVFSTVKEIADYYLQKAMSDKALVGASLGVIQDGEVRTFFYGKKAINGNEMPDCLFRKH